MEDGLGKTLAPTPYTQPLGLVCSCHEVKLNMGNNQLGEGLRGKNKLQ
jgi:hypothetical protein